GAERLEDVVRAAGRGLDDRGDRIRLARVDDVGSAELRGEVELPRRRVDRDDASRARDPAALDDRESDPAATDHDRRLARLNARAVEDRAKAGGDAAADQRDLVERHVAPDADDGVLVHEHALGERAQMDELLDALAVARETWPFLRRPDRGFTVAE